MKVQRLGALRGTLMLTCTVVCHLLLLRVESCWVMSCPVTLCGGYFGAWCGFFCCCAFRGAWRGWAELPTAGAGIALTCSRLAISTCWWNPALHANPEPAAISSMWHMAPVWLYSLRLLVVLFCSLGVLIWSREHHPAILQPSSPPHVQPAALPCAHPQLSTHRVPTSTTMSCCTCTSACTCTSSCTQPGGDLTHSEIKKSLITYFHPHFGSKLGLNSEWTGYHVRLSFLHNKLLNKHSDF